MNREDVIRMAGEAGLAFNYGDFPDVWQTHMDVGRKEIERFAALVAAAEREACAKYLDDSGEHEHAEAIRERGQEPPR